MLLGDQAWRSERRRLISHGVSWVTHFRADVAVLCALFLLLPPAEGGRNKRHCLVTCPRGWVRRIPITYGVCHARAFHEDGHPLDRESSLQGAKGAKGAIEVFPGVGRMDNRTNHEDRVSVSRRASPFRPPPITTLFASKKMIFSSGASMR